MMLKAADLFCGAGGTSAGARDSGAVKVTFALNHWDVAVKTHSANFPEAKHVNSRLDMTHPSECGKIDLLFASPECTHHSNARGGRPMEDQKRAGAWDVLKWVEHHRPSWVVIENVKEFKDWGPLDKNGKPIPSLKGKTFDAWLMALRSLGYKVEHRMLNAADFGAATSRNRLFVICRKGNRNPLFPEPTHGKSTGNRLPGMDLLPWRPAAECIDWSLPIRSIFDRPHPLADNTLNRLEKGLHRFVGPFVAQWDQTGRDSAAVRSVTDPLYTMVTKANMGVAIPYLVNNKGQSKAANASLPMPTQTAHAPHNYVAVPYLIDTAHGSDGKSGSRIYPINQPLGTETTKRSKMLCLPFLSHYYGTDNMSLPGEPLDTITTKGRHGLAVPAFGNVNRWKSEPEWNRPAIRSLLKAMEKFGVADLFYRMLANHELSLAQGFSPDYQFFGSKADVTRQIGNSVSPNVAKAISQAIAG